MRDGRQPKRSDLFLVRIWVSESTAGETEWRGKAQRAVSGEARYFQDLSELADLLRSMMPGSHVDSGGHRPSPEGTQE